jgi:multidrug efflux system outer membrane protein
MRQLQGLIKIALVENKDLQRAAGQSRSISPARSSAKSDFIPGLTASGNAPFGRKTVFLIPGFPNLFNYYLQPI